MTSRRVIAPSCPITCPTRVFHDRHPSGVRKVKKIERLFARLPKEDRNHAAVRLHTRLRRSGEPLSNLRTSTIC